MGTGRVLVASASGAGFCSSADGVMAAVACELAPRLSQLNEVSRIYMSSRVIFSYRRARQVATTDPTFTGRLAGLPEDHDQHGLDRID
jgi:hypothetical protein